MQHNDADLILAQPPHLLAPRKIGLRPRDAAAGTRGSQGTAYSVPMAGAGGIVSDVAAGASGTVLMSNGTGALASFQSVYTAKYTTTDRTSVNNTLTNDTDLVAAVLASTTYLFHFGLFYSCPASTPDFQIAFTCPASPTLLRWGGVGAQQATANPEVTTVNVISIATSGAHGDYGANAGSLHTLFGTGILQNGVNAGSLTLQWAQLNTDAGNAVTLKQGSHLLVFPA